MDINVVVTLGMVLLGTVTFLVSAPASPRSVARSAARRERRVRRNPACARLGDIEVLLCRELPADVTHEVCRLAEEQQLPPSLLWRWAEAHSPTLLALALGAGYTWQELAVSGSSDREIDRTSLEMHAELSECLVGPMTVRAVRHAAATDIRPHRHHRALFASGPRDRTA